MSELEELFAFYLKAAKIADPVLEYRFHPKRRWRLDFAWPTRMVAVEIEGGSWSNGRHVRPAAFEEDCEKYAEAAIAGWRIVRVTGAMVKDGRALTLTERLLATAPGLDVGQDGD